jgi:predicted transposase YdaD
MSFDNLCKLLSEKYPDRFASWVLGTPHSSVEVLKTELSIEPIRADYVTFLQLQGQILHLEFQTKLESNPPLPLRMLDYWVRLHRLYRLPIAQVVVLLLPPPENTVIETAFVAATTRHEYSVIRLWEQEPAIFLNDPALLPLAPLTGATSPEQLLREVAQQVNRLIGNQRQEVSTYTQILAGLKFKKDLIRRIFREGMMRESVIYQEILEEGRQEGERLGRQEQGRSLVLLLLEQQVGQLSPQMRDRISALSLERLEALALALLDFSSLASLAAWLEQER